MFGIIYTPTEGEAIQNFSRLFRRPEGCFLNIFDKDRVEDNLAQWGGADDVDYIVVTDGEEVCSILVLLFWNITSAKTYRSLVLATKVG